MGKKEKENNIDIVMSSFRRTPALPLAGFQVKLSRRQECRMDKYSAHSCALRCPAGQGYLHFNRQECLLYSSFSRQEWLLYRYSAHCCVLRCPSGQGYLHFNRKECLLYSSFSRQECLLYRYSKHCCVLPLTL